VVDGASLSVAPGEAVGLVGESGSGKTLTALALLRLVPEPGRNRRGSVRVDGVDVLAAEEAVLVRLRGATVGPSSRKRRSRSTRSPGRAQSARRRGPRHAASAIEGLVDELLGAVGLDASSMRAPSLTSFGRSAPARPDRGGAVRHLLLRRRRADGGARRRRPDEISACSIGCARARRGAAADQPRLGGSRGRPSGSP